MLHDLLLLTSTLFDIYKFINFKAKKKVITQKGPNEWNYAPHPTPPQPPMFKHQRPNTVTGILYHAGLWNIAIFIPEKQVLAKISTEPIKGASCLTEM